MLISDWSSDVCSSDLLHLQLGPPRLDVGVGRRRIEAVELAGRRLDPFGQLLLAVVIAADAADDVAALRIHRLEQPDEDLGQDRREIPVAVVREAPDLGFRRSTEEHTSELQSLLRISYAVFCLNKK